MVDSGTFGIGSTRGRRIADAHTSVANARLGSRTVGIRPAADLAHSHGANFSAGAVSVQPADGHAEALAAALVDETLRIGRADRAAHGALAGESRGAALGSGARRRLSDAGHVGCRVGEEAGRAGTLRSLVDDIAHGVGSADVGAARISTAAVDAGCPKIKEIKVRK